MQLPKKTVWRRPWTVAVLAFVVLIVGACWLVPAVRQAREQARRVPFVSGLSIRPGGYEIRGSGFPDAEGERQLRETLECVASQTRNEPIRPIGIRIRVQHFTGDRQQVAEPLRLRNETLEPFQRLPTLTYLDFEKGNLDRSAFQLLGSLPMLKYLNLRGTATDDEDVEPLAASISLKTIDLCGTKVSPEGIHRLQSALPNYAITND